MEQLKLCIDAGIFEKLINILQHDDMVVKNEAAWALSNSTSSANPEQFKILVDKGLIKGLGSVLTVKDVRMLAVALEGLGNILNCGAENFMNSDGENRFALLMEQE